MTTLILEQLDDEWVDLLLQAKEIGLTMEEIRYFLQSSCTSNDAALLETQPI
ncbi:anti-repressor SinI family protein [Fictibacillus aquaticus]|uniref:Sin domain-containing protein n=1 Tax=Fictibacillus aquaticus TaxID=2021314 RepID=A0A235F7S2_9BACL|nr:anti-repressor SinI family protein [Fictibacillus aquaticus]OYD57114.1 hypothetical protein CGZ90_13975 [Fictibacillus aquaticus]